jgi:hypothetical protein
VRVEKTRTPLVDILLEVVYMEGREKDGTMTLKCISGR